VNHWNPTARGAARSSLKTTVGPVARAEFGLALVVAWDPAFFLNLVGWNRERNRGELVELNDLLFLGQSQEDLRAVLARPQFRDLQLLGADPGSQEWWIYTPIDLGAGNWILAAQFTDSRLTAAHVRTAHGDFQPDGAPADMGTWVESQH
jgi:hypothetical protein